MYASGRGVAEDIVEGVKWYSLSAEQDFEPAQSSLGKRKTLPD